MKFPFIKSKKPLFSVVIISYNMAREVPRTVQSFLTPYQQGIEPEDIEIIVMENGSPHPVPPDIVASWPKNVRYIEVANPLPSPAKALNDGVAMARGQWVCPVIDGARMVSPGLFKAAKDMTKAHANPVIATIGRHLGKQIQQENVKLGYNQDKEDELLAEIGWPENPYDLYKISCLGGSARLFWFGHPAESNVLILSKKFYQSLGGYDEGFDIAGGGMVNLDFFKRCVEDESSQYVLLIGEASFHQFHGGVTTSRKVTEPSLNDNSITTWQEYVQQYKTIRGKPYDPPKTKPLIYGQTDFHVINQTLKSAKYYFFLREKK